MNVVVFNVVYLWFGVYVFVCNVFVLNGLLCVRMRLVVFNFVHVWFGVFVFVCNIGVPNGLLCVCLVVCNGVCVFILTMLLCLSLYQFVFVAFCLCSILSLQHFVFVAFCLCNIVSL